MAGFQSKMKLPIFGKFSRSSREFHPKFTLIFGIPEFRSILKPRECLVEGVSNLSLKLPVPKELSRFEGELQSEKFPRLSNSKNLDYFRTAGIWIWRGFNIFQKNETPDFWKIFKLREGVSFKNSYYFWNSRIQEYFRTAGIWIGGSFVTLGKTVCTQKAESLSRRVTNQRDSRGYQIPKIGTIFRTAGILIWRGFRVTWNSRFLDYFQG